MNPFQEVILDRLVGAGPDEFTEHLGPLGLAFQALVDAGLIAAHASALSLGYPLLLSSALESAGAMLRGIEDKRQLALAVFTAVPPRPVVAPLPARRQITAALWCARRAHPLICRADCLFLKDAIAQIAHHCDGVPLAADAAARPRFFACAATNTMVWDAVDMAAITVRCLAYHSIDKVLEAAQAERQSPAVETGSRFSASYAGRLVALQLGAAGAADFCIDLARELGI